MAVIDARAGKTGDAAKLLRALADKPSVLVPRPMVLLELARVLRNSNPKEAASIYQQIKREFPDTNIAEQADRGLDSIAPKSWPARCGESRATFRNEMERTIATPPPSAPWAMHVEETRGRRFPEPEHPYRSAYARDRDRIIHCRAFRRLEAKTQVFTTRYSDHFRNRLTHTLEVAQIARTVAGALGLNTELAEALALVHDIGHPPFGHAGEGKLDELMRAHGDHFNHNLHALRIVEHFE